jgi:uncharacterized membrane protein YkvA (DUF1232 family)
MITMGVNWYSRWKKRAKNLNSQLYALYLAYRDPRVPWYAKAFGAMVLAYALSPVDLIPDFIPVLGYLDDIVLIPLGIMLAVKMIPKEIMEGCRRSAEVALSSREVRTWPATLLIVSLWSAVLAVIVWRILRRIGDG